MTKMACWLTDWIGWTLVEISGTCSGDGPDEIAPRVRLGGWLYRLGVKAYAAFDGIHLGRHSPQ